MFSFNFTGFLFNNREGRKADVPGYGIIPYQEHRVIKACPIMMILPSVHGCLNMGKEYKMHAAELHFMARSFGMMPAREDLLILCGPTGHLQGLLCNLFKILFSCFIVTFVILGRET